jgi:hypothetical protein
VLEYLAGEAHWHQTIELQSPPQQVEAPEKEESVLLVARIVLIALSEDQVAGALIGDCQKV